MSACLFPCPICAQPHFNDVDALRNGLIDVATKSLSCPICHETVLGLDKLTIHLFTHTKTMMTSISAESEKIEKPDDVKKIACSVKRSDSNKRVRVQNNNKSKEISTQSGAMKLIKIYPKLPMFSVNTLPFIGISPNCADESFCNKTIVCNQAVNMEKSPTVNISNMTTPLGALKDRCDVCGLYFLDENILKMHKSLMHNFEKNQPIEKLLKFPCQMCSKSFKMRGSLMVHLRVAHYGGNFFNKSKSLGTTQIIDLADVGSANVSQGEEKINVEYTNIDDKEQLSPSSIERNDKQWCCEICHKYFTTKYFLKKHKRLHTGETPYSCNQCNKTFTFQQSYHKHLLYHNDEKPHTCIQCGRSFKELSTLHNHERIHTGEKPFSCETCGKCFRQRVSYLVHRRIHTGVMPYKCTACDKSFRYKVSQRTHKCTVQPPGTVVRQTGDLLQKLMKHKENAEGVADNSLLKTDQCVFNTYRDTGNVMNEDIIRNGAKLSLEDTEAENYFSVNHGLQSHSNPHSDLIDKIIEESFVYANQESNKQYNEPNLNQCELNDLCMVIHSPKNIDTNVPSPSEILRNLCLSNSSDELISEQVPCDMYSPYEYDNRNTFHNENLTLDPKGQFISFSNLHDNI